MEEINIFKIYIYAYHHRIAINFIAEKLINNILYLYIKSEIFSTNELVLITIELNENLC
jgi:hypothetical protein